MRIILGKMSTMRTLLVLLVILCSCSSEQGTTKLDESVLVHHDYPSIKSEPARKFFRSGLSAVEAGQYEIALEYFLKADSLQPGNATILNSLGNSHCYAGDLEAGFSSFRKAMKADSLNGEVYGSYGTWLERQKKHDEAIDVLLLGYSKTNTNQFTHYVLCFNLAVNYYKTGNCDRAIQFIDIAMKHGFENEQFDSAVKDLNEEIKSYCK